MHNTCVQIYNITLVHPMHQCTTIHCTVCLPMHQCTKVEPAPLCTMHYSIVEAHQSKQALCTMHFALHCSRVGPAPPPAPGLRWSAPPVSTRWAPACTFCTQVHSTLHCARVQACTMYVKARRNSTLYFVQLCVRKRRPDSLYTAVQVLLFPL